jgi:hypothetical protein
MNSEDREVWTALARQDEQTKANTREIRAVEMRLGERVRALSANQKWFFSSIFLMLLKIAFDFFASGGGGGGI